MAQQWREPVRFSNCFRDDLGRREHYASILRATGLNNLAARAV